MPNARARAPIFNGIATCGICGCSVVGEAKQDGRYFYYHCTYSKGRHAGVPHLPKTEFRDLSGDCVRDVTVSDDVLFWLREVVDDELSKLTGLPRQRAATLQKEKQRLSARLNRLYDSLYDDIISPEMFKRKEADYKSELAGVDGALGSLDGNNGAPTAQRIFELANRLYPTYLDLERERKAAMLRLLASNYVLRDGSLCPTYRKPFSFLANLPPRTTKLPERNEQHGGFHVLSFSSR